MLAPEQTHPPSQGRWGRVVPLGSEQLPGLVSRIGDGGGPGEAKNGSQRVGVLVPPCSILLQICFKNIIEALNVNSFRLIKFSNILRCDILVFRFAGFGGFVFVVSSLRAGSLWGQKVRKSEYFLVFVI